MSQSTEADALRIAIALAALKYKPTEQSYDAYIIDLRSKFVSEPSRSEESVQTPDAWREHALELEKKFQELQIKYDQTRVELTTLKETHASSETSAETVETLAKQKKTKKKSGQNSSAPIAPPGVRAQGKKVALESVLSGGPDTTAPDLKKALNNTAALSALETLDRLLLLRTTRGDMFSQELLAATMNRALDALGAVLSAQLPPDLDHPVPQSILNLDTLSTLVPRVLSSSLPLLARRPLKRKTKLGATTGKDSCAAMADATLGRLTTAVCIPLIRSLKPLSRSHLALLLDHARSSATGGTKRARCAGASRAQASRAGVMNALDPRPAVLALLRTVMDTLDELATTVAGLGDLVYDLRCCLVLEALRELQSTYAGEALDTCGAPRSAATKTRHEAGSAPRASARAQRLQHLVRKDSLWYLCNVLHLVLPCAPALSAREDTVSQADLSGGTRALLKEAVFSGLSEILHATRRGEAHGGTTPTDTGGAADTGSDGPARASPDGAGAARTGAMTRGRGGKLRSAMGEVERGMLLAVAERVWLGM